MTPPHLHPSSLHRWAHCEARALWLFREPEEERRRREGAVPHVAAWVGTAAHAQLAGQEPPEDPEMLAFDPTTKTLAEAKSQARNLGDVARSMIDAHGIRIIDQERHVERTGGSGLVLDCTVDVIGWSRRWGNIILDLKTGWNLFGALLQVGAYGLAISKPDEGDPVVPDNLLILHANRADKALEPELHDVPAKPAIVAASRLVRRVSMILAGDENPTYNPTHQCAGCPVPDCPVRLLPGAKKGA